MSPTRIWFAGTPEFAAHSLSALINEPDYLVDAVLTQPDRPAGRGRKLSQSAVKTVAQAHNIAIAQPQTLRAQIPLFSELPTPDLIIVAAYGLLLPSWFLALPRLGCINIHASLLPRWRGAAPIQRAIAAGDDTTGISIMQMDAGLDTGAVWLRKSCPIDAQTTAGSLYERLMHLGADALLDALPRILANDTQPQAQSEEHACYAAKLSKAEAAIHWHEPAETIERNIRAYNPYPVAHTQLDGNTWRIFKAAVIDTDSTLPAGSIIAHHEAGIDVATGAKTLRLIEVQLAGKKRCQASALRHGQTICNRRFSA